ncbi:hypothetical protein B0T16DRAFT_317341 [Cercophora newfieldiana]|uniref:SnoaL-like domain-containing protein n=1 Tax=Cercophora newfieldiana TaxID=92897 RepID=A0AA39YTP6_9PEZI|nr:hypothetical protein B0T16DRAFT_317341 [Cercophora newfieldiana]
MPKMMSARRQTVLAVLDAYNSWDIGKLTSLRAPECVHQVLPASLDRPPMSNSEYDTYFSTVMLMFRNFRVEVNDMIEDLGNEKVVVWAKSTAETDIGPYRSEYMLVFYLNNKGDKVTRFLEFVDSAVAKDFLPKLRRHIAEGRRVV